MQIEIGSRFRDPRGTLGPFNPPGTSLANNQICGSPRGPCGSSGIPEVSLWISGSMDPSARGQARPGIRFWDWFPGESFCRPMLRVSFCKKAIRRGRVQYNIVHKHHAFWHIQEQLEICNPRFTSTYSEESMMKTGTLLYSDFAHGPYGQDIQQKVLKRYCTALELQWSGIF